MIKPRATDCNILISVGLPDPPTGVQVELGPQPGTLLVSWQPVTNQPKPPSRFDVLIISHYFDSRANISYSHKSHTALNIHHLTIHENPPDELYVETTIQFQSRRPLVFDIRGR